jgi:rare lipoprotein A
VVSRVRYSCVVVGAAVLTVACAPSRREAREEPRLPPASPPGPAQIGTASWYGAAFHGRRTASGERFDRHALTAASRSLPFGSRVRVTNLTNGRMVIVRVNDRGPVARGRVLDVSYGAARELGMIERGSARVRIEPLEGS